MEETELVAAVVKIACGSTQKMEQGVRKVSKYTRLGLPLSLLNLSDEGTSISMPTI